MRAQLRSFQVFIRQIVSDRMLFLVCAVPLFMALLFRYGVPFAEAALGQKLGLLSFLTPYYLLFDLFLCVMTPYMFCFASAMVILDERDDNIAQYFAVTPVGKRGYLLSRLFIPATFSCLASVLLLFRFSLTGLSVGLIFALSVLASLFGILGSLLIVSAAGNKVEGMAVAKLSGLLMLGVFVPFFISGGVQYLFVFLPSFWIAKLAISQHAVYFAPGLLCAAVWIWLLFRAFGRKLSG